MFDIHYAFCRVMRREERWPKIHKSRQCIAVPSGDFDSVLDTFGRLAPIVWLPIDTIRCCGAINLILVFYTTIVSL